MANDEQTSLLYIVTGSRGAGKTSFCQALIQAARAAGWQVAGLLSNPIFDGTRRIQIVAEDLRAGQMQLLATRKEPDQAARGVATRNWQFETHAIAWGNAVIQASLPADLFVMDELGTLEFERQQGWTAALPALDSRQYRVGVVVLRPELLSDGLQRWPDAYIVEIDTPEDSQLKARHIAAQLFHQGTNN